MSKHYHFETADTVCNQFHKFVNMLKREEEECKENSHGWTKMMKVLGQQKNIRYIHQLGQIMFDKRGKGRSEKLTI